MLEKRNWGTENIDQGSERRNKKKSLGAWNNRCSQAAIGLDHQRILEQDKVVQARIRNDAEGRDLTKRDSRSHLGPWQWFGYLIRAFSFVINVTLIERRLFVVKFVRRNSELIKKNFVWKISFPSDSRTLERLGPPSGSYNILFCNMFLTPVLFLSKPGVNRSI